ncbi:DgyrCDS6633 [Dimorphilus gyrociliatus]|uniref:DgyrCDS6633 n=1 Tax=Dimorphilus gyrociliatus TaxID=2664684 RepID=A0A7I8VQ70_9ANNE|nr:DgyrCDS6633 [Dimorphilus gyrociliatus]
MQQERNDRPIKITTGQQMVASCSGAILTSLFVTPLDVIKIRLQSQAKPFKTGQCFLYCNGLMDHLCTCLNSTRPRPWYQTPGKFTGTFDAFVKIARYEGITRLWSGLPPTLAMAVPATVVYFTCYDHLKYYMGYKDGDASRAHIAIVAGSVARVGAVTLISPLELIRTKMQSERLSYRELSKAIRLSIKSEGISTVMRGLGSTLLRDVPFSALYWYGYELLKSKQMNLAGCTQPTFLQSFYAGAISGTFAAIVTLPFDVIKTHQQIAVGEELSKFTSKSATSSSTLSQIRKLYMQQGIRALFTGLVPRVVKIAPACAIMISSYEYGKVFFANYNSQIQKTEVQMNKITD